MKHSTGISCYKCLPDPIDIFNGGVDTCKTNLTSIKCPLGTDHCIHTTILVPDLAKGGDASIEVTVTQCGDPNFYARNPYLKTGVAGCTSRKMGIGKFDENFLGLSLNSTTCVCDSADCNDPNEKEEKSSATTPLPTTSLLLTTLTPILSYTLDPKKNSAFTTSLAVSILLSSQAITIAVSNHS